MRQSNFSQRFPPGNTTGKTIEIRGIHAYTP